MLGMEEGIFPHARSLEENTLEEERRLAYVALTRAGRRLVLAFDPQRPSRFLAELGATAPPAAPRR
jgi:DNA helicase-2/ATP-dependent DNA helicase PcrA